ncbi:MAG TPA: hypothetical protein VNO75_05500 [Gemmatimonadaceae bacterium]|nr:hypothetical protein [Gemmatimonadaceae bacterium]
MIRARLARYSVWQFRDFVMEKGIAIVLIGICLGYLQLLPLRLAGGPQMDPEAKARFVTSMASNFLTIFVLITLNGMISTDRKQGYYRFMFAKPLSPVSYYGQLFVVNLAGYLAAVLVLCGAFVLAAGSFDVWNLVLYATLIYVAMGGIGFLISAISRFDVMTLAIVWLGSRLLRAIFADEGDWRSTAVQVLPPVHKIDGVASTLISFGTAPLMDVLWLVGYGTLFLGLGLVVLKYRPLGA